jgi:ABC-type antimicrobial peptide transport system permease subunit
MKKTIVAIIIVVLAIIGIIIFGRGSSNNPTSNPAGNLGGGSNQPVVGGATPTPVVPVTETTKVSSKTSQYQNAELGFTLNYPTAWEADNTDTGVTFIMPIDSNQVSTVAKLQADINVASVKCNFPPVTTIKDRGTLAVGSNTLDMITMSNSVQGRGYFDRIYTLQQGSVCYVFHFSSITLAPESKQLTGSNLTQAQNNNKAIVSTTDTDFTSMVKTFAFVQGPAGIDETKAPTK